MVLRWHGFAVPKHGNSADEYEDAFAGNANVGRFAVADGASESSFASLWAKLLVEGYARPSPISRRAWLEPLRQRWVSEVHGLELPWYAEEKRGLGASATFLGLALKRFRRGSGGSWYSSAVGDCCCFQVRGDQLLRAFPRLGSQDFGNEPGLLNSRPDGGLPQTGAQRRGRGQWRLGDRFLLMTDAMAQWFANCYEQGGKPWRAIARVLAHAQPHRAFASWIDELRRHDLRNDDVTVVVIDL